MWHPVVDVEDPIQGLIDFFTKMSDSMSCDEVVCGCPLNNLCQEMSGVDEGFRLRIFNMHQQLNLLIAANLKRISPQLRAGLDFNRVAYFIFASFHGSSSLSKSSQNKKLFDQVITELCLYIANLRK